jgi:glutamate 5-kinase
MKADQTDLRKRIVKGADRWVIKIGSRVIVRRDGRPDLPRLAHICEQVAELHRAGKQVILVSSGAIGAGMEALGLRTRPSSLPDLQMAAAVGQSRLMAQYDRLFSRQKIRTGQVLLTHDGLRHRERHLNARNTILNCLRHGIIPIVNENDAVAVDDIRFGDNDILAALTALLVQANCLLMLTTVDGFRERVSDTRTRRVPYLDGVTQKILDATGGPGSPLSTGGMASKLQAAAMAADNDIPVFILSGRAKDSIRRAAAGQNTGTLIGPAHKSEKNLNGRKRWIAFFHRTEGALVIDEGARHAVVERGRSLLPIGIREVQGSFSVGAMVNILSRESGLVARGLVEYSSEQIRKIMGRKTADIQLLLGCREYDEVIHRDNMVILAKDKGHAS